MMDCNESCSNYWSGCDMQCMDDEAEAEAEVIAMWEDEMKAMLEAEAEAMAIWEAKMMDAEFAEWIAHMEEDFGGRV